MQMGHISILNSYRSGQALNSYVFDRPFEVPPVVFLLADSRGGNSAEVRLYGVTTHGFKAWIVEPKSWDGPHVSQDIAYLAAAPGIHQLPDGRIIEVGKVSTKMVARKDGVPQWKAVSFSHTFSSAPAFVAGLQTMLNEVSALPAQVSKPFLAVATSTVTATGANVALERGEVYRFGEVTVDEVIGYVAMEPSFGQFVDSEGRTVKVAAVTSSQSVKGWQNSRSGYQVDFGGDLSVAAPLVVGSLVTRNGDDGGWLRLAFATSTFASVRVDEDTSQDRERKHTAEKASLIASSGPFSL